MACPETPHLESLESDASDGTVESAFRLGLAPRIWQRRGVAFRTMLGIAPFAFLAIVAADPPQSGDTVATAEMADSAVISADAAVAPSTAATPPAPVESPEVSAQSRVQAIFEDACTSCHDDTDELDLSGDLGQFIGAKGEQGRVLIVAGDPENSYLLQKMLGSPGIEGDLMPLGDDPLPAAQIDVVRQWIAEMPASQPVPDNVEGTLSPSHAAQVDHQVPAKRAAPAFFGTHQTGLNTTTTLGKKVIEMRIHHRFGRVGKPGDGNYLGMASGAVMSLGLAYGIAPGLDVLARWTNTYKDWELGGKYIFLRQEDGRPLSLGVYASGEWLSVAPSVADNRLTGTVQALVSRQWFERWSTQLAVTHAFLSNHAKTPIVDPGDGTKPRKAHDQRGTLAVGFASSLWLGKKNRYSVDVEYQLPLPINGRPDPFYYRGGDADRGGSKAGAWSLGGSARVGLHLFQVFITNTQAIHTNLHTVGAQLGSPFETFGDFFIGFNISRKWKLGK